MNNNLESLLLSAPQHVRDVLLDPETSKTVSAIAHANRVSAAATSALHTEVMLLILGVNNIDKDFASIKASLIDGGVAESATGQVLSDIKNYILPKIQNRVDQAEIKTLEPVSSDKQVIFSNAKLSRSTLDNLGNINKPPIVTAIDSNSKKEEESLKIKRLDPYREDVKDVI